MTEHHIPKGVSLDTLEEIVSGIKQGLVNEEE